MVDKIIRRLKKVVKTNLVYVYDSEFPSDVSLPDGLTWDYATPELIEKYFNQDEKKAKKFRLFLKKECIGVIIHNDDEWVNHGWMMTPNSTYVPLHLPRWVKKLESYWFFHDHTKFEFRGNGFHKLSMKIRLNLIKQKSNINYPIYTDTSPNKFSRFSIESVGFEPAGKITTIRLGHPKIKVVGFGRWDKKASHPSLPK